MFSYIKGNLEVKSNGFVVIDVNGIGFKIFMSENAINKLEDIGKVVKVYTYMNVREDDISLYGFNSNEELRMFELLIGVINSLISSRVRTPTLQATASDDWLWALYP